MLQGSLEQFGRHRIKPISMNEMERLLPLLYTCTQSGNHKTTRNFILSQVGYPTHSQRQLLSYWIWDIKFQLKAAKPNLYYFHWLKLLVNYSLQLIFLRATFLWNIRMAITKHYFLYSQPRQTSITSSSYIPYHICLVTKVFFMLSRSTPEIEFG